MSTLTVDTIQGKTTAGTVAMPAGMVIQTLSFTQPNNNIDTTSGSYVATGWVTSITPKFSTSKILWTIAGGLVSYGSGSCIGYTQLHRQIASGGYSSIYNVGRRYLNTHSYYEPHSAQFMDSPNTTSQVDYQCFFKTSANTFYWAGLPHATDNAAIICTLQEIKQ